MPGTSPLRAALSILREKRLAVLVPPGSDLAIGALVAVGGWSVGLSLPAQLAWARLIRTLALQGPAAFASGLAALQPPTWMAVAVWATLVVLTLILVSGWIRVALAACEQQTADESTWSAGLQAAGRSLVWSVLTLAWIAALAVVSAQAGLFAIRSGLMALSAGSIFMPSLIGIGTAALWSFGLGAGFYSLVVCLLGAITAVAEPRTPLWALVRRAPRLFVAGGGWKGVRELLVVLVVWGCAKIVLLQLIVPPHALRPGFPALLFAIAGTLLMGALALGDGLVLVLAIVLGAVVYRRGAEAVQTPGSSLASNPSVG